MQRIVAHEARIIHLAWNQKRNEFEFRLLYGRTFLTPKLWLPPIRWYDLLAGRPIEFPGWVRLSRRGGYLEILPLKEFRYEIHTGAVPQPWPSLNFREVYDAATLERGALPEEGWSDAHEVMLEKARNDLG